MTAAKTMDTRPAAKLVRCGVQDQHDGEVLQAVWDETGAFFCSIAKDGRAKVWDPKTAQCLWTSEYLIPDIPTKVYVAASHGMRRRRYAKWRHICMDWPGVLAPRTFTSVITSLHLDAQSDRNVTILVAYEGQLAFFSVGLHARNSQFEVCKYGDSAFVGAITSILPCHSRKAEEHPFVIAGSQLGWVSLYPYPRSGGPSTVSPLRKFEAHSDLSSVTALAWNGITLVTGSANGSTSVFDAYTFERLRTFGTPIPRPRGGNTPDRVEGVKQIVLSPEKDALAISVGDRVMGFKADFVPKDKVTKKVGKKKARGTITAKGNAHFEQQVDRTCTEQHALKQLISDSLFEHDKESEYRRRMYGTERQQRENLERLGLNEVEAVEYVLHA
ncbi:hypothetical protein VNI00_010063 [Paramarasmius palmivorus]|uniref:Uncharacterized protein n=1 Tax=Paramarasmius palmivorus TaxID=297713 RepID=A0AAW0CMF4_9AGAR